MAEGLNDWGTRAVPLVNFPLEFALQLRKSTEKLSQVSRLILGTDRFIDLATVNSDSLDWPTEDQSSQIDVGDFRQTLVDTSAFQVSLISGSEHQINLSQSSWLML
jgi:hypothetical protein